jgi:hypothetical protein
MSLKKFNLINCLIFLTTLIIAKDFASGRPYFSGGALFLAYTIVYTTYFYAKNKISLVISTVNIFYILIFSRFLGFLTILFMIEYSIFKNGFNKKKYFIVLTIIGISFILLGIIKDPYYSLSEFSDFVSAQFLKGVEGGTSLADCFSYPIPHYEPKEVLYELTNGLHITSHKYAGCGQAIVKTGLVDIYNLLGGLGIIFFIGSLSLLADKIYSMFIHHKEILAIALYFLIFIFLRGGFSTALSFGIYLVLGSLIVKKIERNVNNI